MIADPSLSLPAYSVDAVAWALSGADDIIEWIDAENYGLHVTLRAITKFASEEVFRPDAVFFGEQVPLEVRLTALRDRRNDIAAAALSLSEDAGAASSTRLARILTEGPRSTWESIRATAASQRSTQRGPADELPPPRKTAQTARKAKAPRLRARQAGGSDVEGEDI